MLYNICSLLLGIFAWLLPLFSVAIKEAKRAYAFSTVSFILCACSLLMQFFEIGNRVSIGDFSAIMDTIRAVIIASVLLVSVTAILNLITLIRISKK